MSELSPSLNWEVSEHQVTSNDRICPGYKALHRDDNGLLLNIVKDSYYTATNGMFTTVVEKLREVTGFELLGYSQAGEGQRVLAYLKNRSGMNIGDFTTENFLVLGNSFDYSTGFFGGNVNRVLRCQNEFGRISQNFRIRHASGITGRIDEMIKYYESYVLEQSAMKTEFESWQGITMSADVKEMFVESVLNVERNENNEISTRKLNQMDNLWVSINREVNAMGDNLWSLFNGVTHYTTHVASGKERVFGNVIGTLADINSRGFHAARKIASGGTLELA